MDSENLLQQGFRDDLSPIVEQEHNYTNKIINIFNSNGYLMVKPPLIEFLNKKDEKNKFILIKKNKEKKLKIRNDITTQVARISRSRYKHYERPIRLCYYGEVLKSEGSILRPERQFLQVGAECIGEESYLADVEILTLTFESLKSVGIKNISIDFYNPKFLNFLYDKELSKNKKEIINKYLQRKDYSKLISFSKKFKNFKFLYNLINCQGNLSKNLKLINKLRLNEDLSYEIDKLLKIYNFISKIRSIVNLNVDFTENKNIGYYSGLNFTVFSKNVRGEVASGGRYVTNSINGENAVGFTCYMDTIIRASTYKLNPKRIIVHFKVSETKIGQLIKKGFIIERFFGLKENLVSEAKRKKCNYILIKNIIKKIKDA